MNKITARHMQDMALDIHGLLVSMEDVYLTYHLYDLSHSEYVYTDKIYEQSISAMKEMWELKACIEEMWDDVYNSEV